MRAKAVECNASSIVFTAEAIQHRLRYSSGDRIYVMLPVSFDYGFYQILLAALSGATVIFAGDCHLVSQVRRLPAHRATVLPIVPSMICSLQLQAQRDPNSF